MVFLIPYFGRKYGSKNAMTKISATWAIAITEATIVVDTPIVSETRNGAVRT
ncbi:hypothetical protein ES708_25351 [subsurface metagenome]